MSNKQNLDTQKKKLCQNSDFIIEDFFKSGITQRVKRVSRTLLRNQWENVSNTLSSTPHDLFFLCLWCIDHVEIKGFSPGAWTEVENTSRIIDIVSELWLKVGDLNLSDLILEEKNKKKKEKQHWCVKMSKQWKSG